MKVWLAALRTGISYHDIAPSGRTTRCGRYMGESPEQLEHGHVLPVVRAVDDWAAKSCKACEGQTPPRIVPKGQPSRGFQ